jgi:hypothetical protein
MNTVLSEIKEWNTGYLRKLENHINALAYSRAVAQAVSRWLPTAAARVRVRTACGVCGRRSDTGQVFSEFFCFPCQSFHQIIRYHNHPGLA